MKFDLQYTDPKTNARAGKITTDHGEILTPIFMPVGTLGSVKGVHLTELKEDIKAQIILGNTYHLYLRPGLEVIEKAGGLHRFNGFDRPMLTDSGGFQVFSLSGIRKMKEEGVEFRSHIDGSKHLFTPERVMDIERTIGADIMMAFDECTPGDADYNYARKSMELTHRWLDRCLKRFNETEPKYGYHQSLFPIVQGCVYPDLRRRSAEFVASKEAEGNLLTSGATTPNVNYIETTECNGFVFTAVDGGYAIQNHDGRYLVQSGNSFAFTDEKPSKDAAWDVSIDDADGIAIIKNAAGYIICFSTESQTFGCFLPGETDGTHLLPQLYMQREYPTFTVTPAQGTTLERLSEIIVTCDEGIKASNLKVASEGAVTTFTVKQTNSNTLTLTAKKELTTINNVDLNITFTGDILLNPNGMNMSIPIPTRYGKKTLVSYKLTGDAPAATIDNIDPADGSVLEELTSVVFTFSYYMNASEDESLQPRLYLEGTTELIPVEYSTKPEDGVKTMTQGAIKATAPVTANGTYILEVPTGYFIDANNNAIDGVTLKYTVQNDTGIEEILGADVNSWTVYNVAGVKVLETTDAAKVKALTKGLYIINGVKSIVK